MSKSENILVLDFGSQYSQLIARRIRECHVYSRIVPFRISADEIRKEAPAGIILSGGPASLPGRSSEMRSRDFQAWHSGSRHLLRNAVDGADSRRGGRARQGT